MIVKLLDIDYNVLNVIIHDYIDKTTFQSFLIIMNCDIAVDDYDYNLHILLWHGDMWNFAIQWLVLWSDYSRFLNLIFNYEQWKSSLFLINNSMSEKFKEDIIFNYKYHKYELKIAYYQYMLISDFSKYKGIMKSSSNSDMINTILKTYKKMISIEKLKNTRSIDNHQSLIIFRKGLFYISITKYHIILY